MATAISVIDARIKESFPTVLLQAESLEFPLLQRMKKSAMNVTQSRGSDGQIGRGFEVRHKYSTGVSGRRLPANPLGPTMVDVGVAPLLLEGSTANTDLTPYPVGAQAPHAGLMTRTLVLHRSTGVLSMPIAWRQANMLNAAQWDVVANDLRAAGIMEKRVEGLSFHAYRANDGTSADVTVLGRIATGGVAKATKYIQAGTTNANFCQLTIDPTYGRIANFANGMEIDIVADSSGTIQTGTATDGTDVRNYDSSAVYIQVVVTDVDPINNIVTCVGVSRASGTAHAIQTFSATTGWQGTNGVAAGDWIVGREQSRYTSGTRPMLSFGLNDWMKQSGRIMGGAAGSQALDVDQYSQFKSKVISSLSAPLLEETLSQLLMGYQEAYPNIDLDTILTTNGVTQEFVTQLATAGNNQGVFQRAGQELKVQGGWTLRNFVTPTKEYEWWTSPVGLKGSCYVIGMKNGNFMQYIPPHLGGSSDNYTEDIQFPAPGWGHTGIFMPELDGNGRPKDIAVAPYDRYILVAPKMPNGILIQGITEASMLQLT